MIDDLRGFLDALKEKGVEIDRKKISLIWNAKSAMGRREKEAKAGADQGGQVQAWNGRGRLPGQAAQPEALPSRR